MVDPPLLLIVPPRDPQNEPAREPAEAAYERPASKGRMTVAGDG
jgi:hypothetical protein